MKLEEQFKQMNAILSEADCVLLASHENPDPDAVGSVLALALALGRQGKRVIPYLPTPPVSALGFLAGFQNIRTALTADDAFDAAICVDYGDFFRLRLPSTLAVPAMITIDHHPFSTQQGNVMVIAPEYSSACELIYWWFRWTGFPLDKAIATCLLCGIVSDTGGFLHTTTSQRTFRAVAELLACGTNLSEVFFHLRALGRDASSARALGRVLSKITIDEKTQLAYSWVAFHDLAQCESGNFYLQDIPSVIATASPAHLGAFFIEEGDGFVRGSLRAEPFSGRAVDFVARALGGGGHKYAAGFRYRGTREEVLKKVLELIE